MDIFGQFVAPNRKAIEEPKEALTFFYLHVSIINLFINRVYER